MTKKLLSLDYHPQLIKNMAEALPSSLIASGIIAPLLIIYTLYDAVDHSYLYIWFFLHIIVFFTRLFALKKVLNLIEIQSSKIILYLKINIILSAIVAILYGAIAFISVTYAPDLNIFMIVGIITVIAAGSLSTLSAIFYAFILFLSLMILPLIIVMFYHGGDMFILYGFVLIIFLIIYSFMGYRQHIILRDAISMKETFRTIFNKSTDGIILIQGTRLKDCNESIVKMFKYSSKEALLKSYLSNFMPRLQPDGTSSVKKMLLLLKMALRNGSSSFEWLHKKTDGEIFWCEIVLTRVYLEDQELVHGVWRDISARKLLEKEQVTIYEEVETLNKNLEQKIKDEVSKNREKDKQLFAQSRLAQMGEMLAMIAHQWRQPLAAIASTSGSLSLKAKLGKLNDEMVIQRSDDITQYSQYLSQTVNDFREFFKPNKELKMTNFNELIENVLRITNASIKKQNITVIKELCSKNNFISYPNELKQVIVNLIKNSEDILLEKHTVHPFIKIETYDENKKVVLKISDNGGGISKEIIEKIFDPYFSTKTKKDGTGLGLYMSKIIIEEHCDGELVVSNGAEGAIFKIVLSCA